MVHDKTGPDRKKLDRRNARQQPIKFKDSGFRTGKMLKKKIIYNILNKLSYANVLLSEIYAKIFLSVLSNTVSISS